MGDQKTLRLGQVARKLNVGISTITKHLESKGFDVDNKPNAKITSEQFNILAKEFASSLLDKEEASGLKIGSNQHENVVIEESASDEDSEKDEDDEFLIKNISIDKDKVEDEDKGEADKEDKTVEADEEQERKAEEQEEKTEKSDTGGPKLKGVKVLGKIDLDEKKQKEEEQEKDVKDLQEGGVKDTSAEETGEQDVDESEKEDEKSLEPKKVIKGKSDKLKGLKVVGKIDLPQKEKEKEKEKGKGKGKEKEDDQPVASSDDQKDKRKKRPRKRITKYKDRQDRKKKADKEEPSDKEIQEQIKATLAKLKGGKKSQAGARYRKEKRSAKAEAEEEKKLKEQEDSKKLGVTEFISAQDLASLMDVNVNEIIATCMNLGMFVSINQRLDAEAITIIADEFGYDVEFTSAEEKTEIEVEEDSEKDLESRAPIVTIMGHVDHGKTSLLDYIRKSKVTEAEKGGITQHIGAYDVITESGQKIAFLDTPGHEAFTAMRARGAKVTDVVIIVVAADDSVMPQTKEAINHAQVAGVPIVIAINKIDKPNANVEKIKEELSKINILVEDWGGKYQCQEISAKTGEGVNELLEKVLLEAELLELKANPDKNAIGTVIEASLDKGRGYVATILIQAGTMRVGDVMVAGQYYGKVKAMFDHTGQKVKEAGPSTPVLVLGLDGAPQAGDTLNVMETEREAREIANKREQLQREQSMRTKKHITLDEIGRRLAIGTFQELNVIVKGDVDGSVEALSDALLKLSTDEVQVNIIHKGVGQISESDVLLASASDAVIVGFQVRPSAAARKTAENEEIEIRLYSVIYDAINEIKDAMEGMLAPEVKEVITGNAEVREVFKISKVGTVAGCMVTDGVIKRKNDVRVVRDGIVINTGEIAQLKRFKDDVSEVKSGFECGISIKSFNDLKEGDVIESFEEQEVKRSL